MIIRAMGASGQRKPDCGCRQECQLVLEPQNIVRSARQFSNVNVIATDHLTPALTWADLARLVPEHPRAHALVVSGYEEREATG
jgi:hypothetical protein